MNENEPEEPVVLPIEDSLDLHTFQPREVRDLLDDYLKAAHSRGYREVLIVHGKGSGILRERVHGLLRNHPFILSFRQADASRGGWGATVVVLRETAK